MAMPSSSGWYEWAVSWKAAGAWYVRYFDSFRRCQEFARALHARHLGDEGFSLSATRMMAVNTHDLLVAGQPSEVRLAPHPEGTSETIGGEL